MEVFLILVILIAVVAVGAQAVARNKKTGEAWKRAAEMLHLAFHPPVLFQGPRITGTMKGFKVYVSTITRRSGNTSKTYAQFRIYYPPLRLGLRLTRERFFSGLAKYMGAQDIQLNDAFFDDDVLVKGKPQMEEQIIQFLTPARRMRLHRFLMSHREAEVADHQAEVVEPAGLADTQRIVAVLKDLVRVAWCVTGEREEDHTLEQAMIARHEGRIEKALALLDETPKRPAEVSPAKAPEPSGETPPGKRAARRRKSSRPPPLPKLFMMKRKAIPVEAPESPIESVEEKLIKGELLFMGERRDEAKKIFDQALEERPGDPEIQSWSEKALGQPDEEKTPAAKVEPLEGKEESLDVRSVCETLFAPNHLSFDAQRIFDERYVGKTVTWQGVLRAVEKYATDFVFGTSAGTKCTFEVFELPASLYGERTVLAFVKLPEELAESLKEQKGATMTFEGRLFKADGFMRNLYITDGRLVR